MSNSGAGAGVGGEHRDDHARDAGTAGRQRPTHDVTPSDSARDRPHEDVTGVSRAGTCATGVPAAATAGETITSDGPRRSDASHGSVASPGSGEQGGSEASRGSGATSDSSASDRTNGPGEPAASGRASASLTPEQPAGPTTSGGAGDLDMSPTTPGRRPQRPRRGRGGHGAASAERRGPNHQDAQTAPANADADAAGAADAGARRAAHHPPGRHATGRSRSGRFRVPGEAQPTRRILRARERTGRGARRVGQVAGRGVRRVHQATRAQGAGDTGLYRVIEMHGVNTAGDTLIAVSLAGTLFFAVPLGEARSNVALYLIMTMLPFALLAPLIGPTLDRFRHGRRWALGSTLALRGFLCWVLADAVTSGHWSIYPAAFGCLVASKAYNVSRAASVPRLMPEGVELVTANSRISVAGVVGASLAAPLGIGLAMLSPQWSLRLGFVVFVVGTILSIQLPARIDSSADEVAATRRSTKTARSMTAATGRLTTPVIASLRANAALRMLSGFLTMFLAFLLRDQPVGGIPYTVTIGLVAVAAGLGSTSATALGASFTLARPDFLIILLVSGAAAAASLTALLYGLITVLVVGVASGFSQQLGKLCQDAIIQREVDEHVRTSAFARAETLMQLAWVLGGTLGITLPLRPSLGLGIIAAALVVGLALALQAQRRRPATDAGGIGTPGFSAPG